MVNWHKKVQMESICLKQLFKTDGGNKTHEKKEFCCCFFFAVVFFLLNKILHLKNKIK